MTTNLLIELAWVDPAQLIRLAIDLCKQKKEGSDSLNQWEIREKGSTEAVINAYAYGISLLAQGELLVNLDTLKKLHARTMSNSHHAGVLKSKGRLLI